jgi:hypothetical protein
MAMTEKERRLLALFEDQIALATQAGKRLGESLDRVAEEELDQLAATPEGAERLDALTIRFARLSDLLTQQVFRLADLLELEPEGSLIDRLHRAEKRGWIDSADDWKRIRQLRNSISHEYLPERWKAVVREVLRDAPALLQCVSRIEVPAVD